MMAARGREWWEVGTSGGANGGEMKVGPRVFVFFVFVGLGLSFIATTGALVLEFGRDDLWLDFLTSDSHLFLFFPTFAIVALVAFYLPSCAITDLYWHHLPWGRLRFAIGFLVLAAAAWTIAAVIVSGQNKSIWTLKPEVLFADAGEPADCLQAGGNCARLPVVEVVKNLRDVSHSRLSMRPLVRNCQTDPLIERTSQVGPRRYCMVTTRFGASPALKTDQECCRAQQSFLAFVSGLQSSRQPGDDAKSLGLLRLPLRFFDLQQSGSNLSMTGLLHGLLLPLKVMFLLVLVAISILMTVHLRKIEQLYRPSLRRMETGLLIGTFATLFFPLMSQAFLQSLDAMVGDQGRGNFSNIVPVMSFAFGVWTLMILLYFYRRGDKEAEIFAKIGGAAAGIVALVQYDAIIDFLVRTVGSGADWSVVVAAAVLAPVMAVVVLALMLMPNRAVSGQAGS
jgi:hypothetical protein